MSIRDNFFTGTVISGIATLIDMFYHVYIATSLGIRNQPELDPRYYIIKFLVGLILFLAIYQIPDIYNRFNKFDKKYHPLVYGIPAAIIFAIVMIYYLPMVGLGYNSIVHLAHVIAFSAAYYLYFRFFQ